MKNTVAVSGVAEHPIPYTNLRLISRPDCRGLPCLVLIL
ncbi:hypothetical protein SLEP1_g33908 [Rubroshorea leprosula]|uniref:Uncharacterized protein n=1 Tax=Rubroshorea leprosula TaxID=152421 RepID=A0AAV5KI32_9ROSI|nr:hypothetical protein SLEP1_g33908 [Rubroshorea leprosula]